MNISIIKYFIGWVIGIESILMLLPVLIAVIYQETSGFYFAALIAAGLVIAWLLAHKKPKNTVFYARDGFVAVALSWIVLSIFGALPFWISREIPSFTNALFETISGFTTTGASILEDVEALTHCMLMWRSFTHWIGGMGVLVFILAILPMAVGYNMHIMRAESPGPSVGKMVPKVATTAKILYLIYFGITVVEIVLLLAAGMPWFDSVAMSVGTAGTGGFGVLGDSCASYTFMQRNILTLFMILFGVNFNVYYLFLIRKWKDALGCEEMRAYLGIILAATLFIGWNSRGFFMGNLVESFHHAAFTVASVITTTGFGSADFDLWPETSKAILVMLMFVGACAGSTGGGMKVSRWVIAAKTVYKELMTLIHPRAVRKVKFEGKPVEHNVIRSINTYIIAYVFVYAVSLFLICFDGFDLITNFTAVAATFNNIGPGLNLVGPTRNFNLFSDFSKYILMFDMLAGRLEVFPMLVLFFPGTWRRE